MKYDDEFLQLIERPLDSSQHEALAAPGNTVIAAGAGSGKTQVLATRFAWLVLTGQAEAEQILTLTFTNKAASEMYQRIYDTLRFFADHDTDDKLKPVHKQRAQKALEAFSEVHIQTLDSYCSGIVRQCANRYGIKPDFVTGSGDGERQVKDSAFRFIMKNRESPAVKYFANPGALQDFAENIFAKIILEYTSLATEDGWFLKNFAKQTKEICNTWNRLIIGSGSASLYSFVEVIKNTLETHKDKDSPAKAPYVNQLNKIFGAVDDLLSTDELSVSDIENHTEAVSIAEEKYNAVLTEINIAQAMNGKIRDVGTKVTPLRDEFYNFNAIISFIINYEVIKDLNLLLDEFLNEVNTSKRISGNLTFADISELALKVLMENEDIRNQEKHACRKIMIDEFQDNNGKNRDLLYLLALKDGAFEDNGNCKIEVAEGRNLHDMIKDYREDGKLFFVGDEKQSIYKFRGADVKVFNELTGSGENNLVYMTTNYRSDANLVKAFNQFFHNGSGIFDSGLERVSYEAYYDKDACKNGEELPALTKDNVPVHFCIFDTSEIKENEKELPEKQKNLLPEKDQKAYFIAKKIYELHKQGIGWDKFAILDKGRTDRGVLTKYLSMFGIPYTVDLFKNIFQDGIVNDFYNFLRICVYPSDVNAWAAYLCSPLAGLSEKALEIVLSYFDCLDEAETCEKLRSELGDEAARYFAARELYSEMRPRVLREKLTATLSYLWNERGYKYETMLTENLLLCSEHFDMLFELGRQADEGGKTVAWFIDQLAILKADSFSSNDDTDIDASEISYPLEREAAVEIMTIHKSKGLQFDHVFIYGCTDLKMRSANKSYFYDEENGVSVKASSDSGNYFFLRTKELEQKKEIAEFRRLIYVAVTRAIHDVYIVGSFDYAGKNEGQMQLIERTCLMFYPEKKDGFNPDAGFDLSFIPASEYADLPKGTELSLEEIREKIAKKFEDACAAAEAVVHECRAVERKTPSSLEAGFDENTDFDTTASQSLKQRMSYDGVEVLVDENFTAADFGTLVHAYLEMQALGTLPEEYEPEPKYFKNLTDAKIAETKEACIKMCHDFAASSIGAELKGAQEAGRFWRAEWGFRMFWKCNEAPDGAIFTGSIDLIYENADGTYTICDYKSDNEINSEKYRGQQECYRAAASKMLKVPEEKISLLLYFLKHNECVNIST